MHKETDLNPQRVSDFGIGIVKLTTDIIVAGYIAIWYAGSGTTPRPARPGFASESKHVPIVVGSTLYMVAPHSRMIRGVRIQGLAITKQEGHQSGGGPKTIYWGPLNSFHNVTVEFEGCVLTEADLASN